MGHAKCKKLIISFFCLTNFQSNSMQKVKIIHVLLLKILPLKQFCKLINVQEGADHFVTPSLSNSGQKITVIRKVLFKILSLKEFCNLIGQETFLIFQEQKFS